MVKRICTAVILSGCISNVDSEKKHDGTLDTSATGDVTEPAADNSVDDQSPSILSADAWCYRIDVGGLVETWKFIAEATDPQGVETLANYIPGGAALLDEDGNEIDAISLICTDGECSTTVNSTAIGATCSDADRHKVRFFVTDEDGHQSDALTIDTRLGTDENG